MNLSNIISIVADICTFVVANYQVRKALENQEFSGPLFDVKN